MLWAQIVSSRARAQRAALPVETTGRTELGPTETIGRTGFLKQLVQLLG